MAANAADREKLHHICSLSYKAQAVWFLNSFWNKHESEAEKFWAYVEKAASLDTERRGEGSALDELNAHRLLEIFDETLTVREMRTQLRSVGAIDEKEHPKLVPLAHLLLARYKADWHWFVNAPQGSEDEINAAQAKLDACKAAFEESEARAHDARQALAAAQSAEASAKAREAEAVAAANEAKTREEAAVAAANEAKAREAEALARQEEALAREAEAKAAEAPFKAAQEEVEAALAEVHRQESEYQGKIADAKQRSEEGGAVSKGKAAAELAQLQAEDPLPLRKAKITLEAANKRAEKARAPFLEATQIAEAARAVATQAANEASSARAAAERSAGQATQARQQAEQARQRSEQATHQAEQALAAAEASLQEAEAFLEHVKETASGGKGALWWIDRELHEQRKFLPSSRGGIARH
jgi:hypothetical protein